MCYAASQWHCRLIRNLISNAIKATSPGGRVSVKSTVDHVEPVPVPDGHVDPVQLLAFRPNRDTLYKVEIPKDAKPMPLVSYARVSVTDTGIGLSREDLQALFQPFKQVGSKRKSGGTGLGERSVHHTSFLLPTKSTCYLSPSRAPFNWLALTFCVCTRVQGCTCPVRSRRGWVAA